MKPLIKKTILVEGRNGEPVILDEDLADFFGVTVRALRQSVTRHETRFKGNYYRFTIEEAEARGIDVTKGSTAGKGGNRKKTTPFVFNEWGFYAAASVVNAKTADKVFRKVLDQFKAQREVLDALRDREGTLKVIDRRLKSLEDFNWNLAKSKRKQLAQKKKS